MTDTLIALSSASDDKLQRLSGYTSTPADSAIAMSSIALAQNQTILSGCNWNKDGDACFVGSSPAGVGVTLDGYSSTKKREVTFTGAVPGGGSFGITCDEDNPIIANPSAVSSIVRKFAGWTSTSVDSLPIVAVGVDWDGRDLYVVANELVHAWVRRYKGFSSTVEHEFDAYSSIDHSLTGITFDGRDTSIAGEQNNKLYKLRAFSSTPIGSEVSLAGFLPDTVSDTSHMSYAERTSQTTPAGSLGTYWCNGRNPATANGKLHHHVGFTSTSLGSVDLGLANQPQDLTFDGTNIYWCGKANTNNPILRKCSGFSSTVVSDIATSGLGDADPQGMSWDGANVIWAGAGLSETLYRQSGFTSTPNSSAACPGGNLNPVGVSWIGTHTLWVSSQSVKIIKSPGFSSTIAESFTPPSPTGGIWVKGASFTGTDVLWVDYSAGDTDASLVKQVGFSTTIKDIVYVASISNQPSGIEHGSIAERIAPGYAISARPRVSSRKRKRRNRPTRRTGHPSIFATQPTIGVGIAPLVRPKVPRRVRHKRRGSARRIGHPSQHAAQPAIDVPPALGDIMWSGLTSQAMYLQVGFTSSIKNTVSLSAQPTGPAGMSWDMVDAYVTFNDGSGSSTYLDRFAGFSSTVKNQVEFSGRFLSTVAWNGTGIMVSDSLGNHCKLAGLTTTVTESYSVASIIPNYGGLSWNGADVLWTALNPTPRVYRNAGFSSVVVDEVPQSVNPSDCTWDGANAYVCQISTGRLRKLAGLTGTITDTVDISASDNFPAGVVLADLRYRLGGANPVRRSFVCPRKRKKRRGQTILMDHPSFHAAQPAAPVAFSLAIFRVRGTRRVKRRKHGVRARSTRPPLADIRRHYFTARGKYRVFNAAVYRFYRSNVGPPTETDTPFATSATLPSTPANTYANGTWWISVSYFNGVVDSGFLPLGPNGETFVRLDIAGGAVTGSPPQPPGDWRLEVRAGGVIRVVGFYLQTGANRATDWAITYTTNGSTPGMPPGVSPTVTVLMPTNGLAILSYDLPAQANGTTVKVRLQTKRSTFYSENSVVKTAIADAAGPSAVATAQRWPGRLPENL